MCGMESPLFNAGATERLNMQAEIKRKGRNGEGERRAKRDTVLREGEVV